MTSCRPRRHYCCRRRFLHTVLTPSLVTPPWQQQRNDKMPFVIAINLFGRCLLAIQYRSPKQDSTYKRSRTRVDIALPDIFLVRSKLTELVSRCPLPHTEIVV